MPFPDTPLPIVSHPTFPILVPSLNVAKRFRPFTVKEEKILLMAKESAEPIDHLRAVHQIVTNCSIEPDLNVSSLATFDLEWLYLKLSAASINSKVKQAFNDVEEVRNGLTPLPVYEFDIDLDMVKAPVVPPTAAASTIGHTQIKLESGDGVQLRYPPAILYTDPEFVKNGEDAILYRSTVSIFTATQKWDTADFTQEQVKEYYEGWSIKDMEKVSAFLGNQPSMEYKIEYKNSYGNDRVITLSGLTDFFTF